VVSSSAMGDDAAPSLMAVKLKDLVDRARQADVTVYAPPSASDAATASRRSRRRTRVAAGRRHRRRILGTARCRGPHEPHARGRGNSIGSTGSPRPAASRRRSTPSSTRGEQRPDCAGAKLHRAEVGSDTIRGA
jgi:hypothetical protein